MLQFIWNVGDSDLPAIPDFPGLSLFLRKILDAQFIHKVKVWRSEKLTVEGLYYSRNFSQQSWFAQSCFTCTD